MVYLHSSIPVDHRMNMAKFEHMNQSNRVSKKTPISDCDQSRSALIDLIILIAVVSACGFLIYPYIILLLSETLEILEPIMPMLQQEAISAPMIYGLLGLAVLTLSMAMLVITFCKNPKCGQPGCRGLQKAAEFDIQIETEDCIKNSSSMKSGLKKGLFEFPRDYFRELEAELKKIAPANGRAVLVFRARCGCPVVRVEVPGPKKNNRKMKK